MSENKINSLTPEQEALIPVYREKWRAIALSTEPIDRQKAAEAVKTVYAAIGYKEPEILFFDSPYGALKFILHPLGGKLRNSLGSPLGDKLNKDFLRVEILSNPMSYLGYRRKLVSRNTFLIVVKMRVDNQIKERLESQLNSKLRRQLRNKISNLIQPGIRFHYGGYFDFCNSILK